MIYIAGAGPGDPGLVTVRTRALLEEADAVVYDALVSDAIVARARPQARRVSVGKRIRSGRPADGAAYRTITALDGLAPTQSEIHEQLVKLHREFPRGVIVRLKGGDPFVFGRGGEEAVYLATQGIPFEVIPGVSSALAAPACAGIPVTHRGLSGSVTVVAGTRRDGAHSLDYPALARVGGTLVFLMGAGRAGEIAQALCAAGMPSSTPAAAVQWGSCPWQRSVATTLGELPAEAVAFGLGPPAVLVVGDVVGLKESMDWFEQRPLFGRRIIVTLMAGEACSCADELGLLGADVILAPALVIQDLDAAPLDRALDRLDSFTDLLLTSVPAVRILASRLAATGRDARALAGLCIGVIGSATAAALHRSLAVCADVVAEPAQAEGLLAALGNPAGRRFLHPRARDARDVLERGLGDALEIVPAYAVIPGDLEETAELIRGREVDAVVVGSAAAARALIDAVGADWPNDVRVLAIGPVTATPLRDAGIPTEVAVHATRAGLVEAAITALGAA